MDILISAKHMKADYMNSRACPLALAASEVFGYPVKAVGGKIKTYDGKVLAIYNMTEWGYSTYLTHNQTRTPFTVPVILIP